MSQKAKAKKKASYEDLFTIPENMTGEIVDGELIVSPRPSRKHIYAASTLGSELGPVSIGTFHSGRHIRGK